MSRCQPYIQSVTCPPQLKIYFGDFSGEGLFTHTTTWDLWPHRRVCSATLNTYGLGLPFNHYCNRPKYYRRAPMVLNMLLLIALGYPTPNFNTVWSGNRTPVWKERHVVKSTPRTSVLKKQLACRCQRYIRSVTETYSSIVLRTA